MTSVWAALCAEALALFAVTGAVTGLLRSRLRGGEAVGVAETVGN